MKIKYILLAIAAAMFCLPACKKDNKKPVQISNSSLLGKWNEVKFHITQNNSNGVVTDTTITAASLGANDYAQFNNNYTVDVFQSAAATPGGASPDYISENIYNYTISGSTVILAPQAILFNINTPAGSITWVVTFIDANNIDLRYTNNAGANKIVSDTYYTRAK